MGWTRPASALGALPDHHQHLIFSFLLTLAATTLFLPNTFTDGLPDLEGKIQLLKAPFVAMLTHLTTLRIRPNRAQMPGRTSKPFHKLVLASFSRLLAVFLKKHWDLIKLNIIPFPNIPEPFHHSVSLQVDACPPHLTGDMHTCLSKPTQVPPPS